MSEEKVLTKEIVEQRPIKGDTLYFWRHTSIEDAAAEFLGTDKYHGIRIELRGLKQLTDTAAAGLSKHRGTLLLSGISELSDNAAVELSKHRGELDLSGISELSDEAAKSLSKLKGELWLLGLSEFSDVAAQSLGSRSHTFFSETTSRKVKNSMVITKEVALEHDNSLFVDLNEYGRIDDDAAAVFGGRDFDEVTLSLNGLTEISDIAAEHLSKHKGDLYLDGLTELSDSAAKSLASCDHGLSLEGLKLLLSDSAAAILGEHGSIKVTPFEWTRTASRAYHAVQLAKTKNDGCFASLLMLCGLLWGIYELTP